MNLGSCTVISMPISCTSAGRHHPITPSSRDEPLPKSEPGPELKDNLNVIDPLTTQDGHLVG